MAISGANYDFLIIGQGLAGSILSFNLIKRGMKVLVIDNNHFASSSHVAAGIINPITGQKLVLDKDFEQYTPLAKHLYRNMESEFNAKIYSHVRQQRLLINQQQLELFQQRLSQNEITNFISSEHETDASLSKLNFGSADILNTVIVNTKVLLSSTKQWLCNRDSYLSSEINYNAIQFKDDRFEIGQITANKIIFCEGHQAINNPWLKDLPFKLSKGEIITVKHNHKTSMPILNWGNWLVPSFDSPESSNTAKLGSNFVWDDLRLEPNAVTQTALLASLHKHTTIKAQAIKAEVGIRPTTLRRDPFIGSLSTLTNAFCFNGFGSKGCLLIPYYAELLCDHLLQHKPLPDKITKWL